MHSVTGQYMHSSVDCTVDNPETARSAWLRWIAEDIGGQVEPRPPAVDELVEVAGQPLLEIIVFRAGAGRRLDGRRAVHAERDRPHLPGVALRGVVPPLHGSDLPGAGIAGDGLPVC